MQAPLKVSQVPGPRFKKGSGPRSQLEKGHNPRSQGPKRVRSQVPDFQKKSQIFENPRFLKNPGPGPSSKKAIIPGRRTQKGSGPMSQDTLGYLEGGLINLGQLNSCILDFVLNLTF